MTAPKTARSAQPIEPLYRPSGTEGEFILCSEELDLNFADRRSRLPGEITLRLLPEPELLLRDQSREIRGRNEPIAPEEVFDRA